MRTKQVQNTFLKCLLTELQNRPQKRLTVLDELGSNLGSSVCGVDDSSSAASGNSLGGGGILADNHSVRRQYDETINVRAQIDLHDVIRSQHGVLCTKEGVIYNEVSKKWCENKENSDSLQRETDTTGIQPRTYTEYTTRTGMLGSTPRSDETHKSVMDHENRGSGRSEKGKHFAHGGALSTYLKVCQGFLYGGPMHPDSQQ